MFQGEGTGSTTVDGVTEGADGTVWGLLQLLRATRALVSGPSMRPERRAPVARAVPVRLRLAQM